MRKILVKKPLTELGFLVDGYAWVCITDRRREEKVKTGKGKG